MSVETEPVVYVVDDDPGVRDSLRLLLQSVGMPAALYDSAAAFLQGYRPGSRADCLVADIRMPGMSGLELQQTLIERSIGIPIVFITGHGDVPMAVEAMKAGAVDFLQKPFRDQALLDRINRALELSRAQLANRVSNDVFHQRVATLTPREAEVMELVVQGNANKVIALDLGVSQRTVELHRARVMRKMGVRSLAELVTMVERSRTS